MVTSGTTLYRGKKYEIVSTHKKKTTAKESLKNHRGMEAKHMKFALQQTSTGTKGIGWRVIMRKTK